MFKLAIGLLIGIFFTATYMATQKTLLEADLISKLKEKELRNEVCESALFIMTKDDKWRAILAKREAAWNINRKEKEK